MDRGVWIRRILGSHGGPMWERRLLLVGVFAAMLALPAGYAGPPPVHQHLPLSEHLPWQEAWSRVRPNVVENRTLAPWPGSPGDRDALRTWPARFDAFVADRFGFRVALVRLGAAIRLDLLRSSDSPAVAVGRDGWMFLAHGRVVDDRLGTAPPDPRTLRALRLTLEERRDWLREQGSGFVFAIAPNKLTVHGENAPRYLRRPSGGSYREQLLSHLRASSDLEVVDLAPALRERARREQVYFRTDTHWTPTAGLVGYREIARRLRGRKGFGTALADSQLRGRRCGMFTDLARKLGKQAVEYVRCPEPAGGWRAGLRAPAEPHTRSAGSREMLLVSERGGAAASSAVLIGDSFLLFDAPLLAEHFRRALHLVSYLPRPGRPRESFPIDLLAAERPDLVVLQLVENQLRACNRRNCLTRPGGVDNEPVVRQARLRRLFRGARAEEVPVEVGRAVVDSETRHTRFRVASLPARGPRAWIARVELAARQKVTLRTRPNNAAGTCVRNLELDAVALSPGRQVVFLCASLYAALPALWLEVEGAADAVAIEQVELRAHPDLDDLEAQRFAGI